MLTKIEIRELVKKANLSAISNDYIDEILRNFDDKEIVSKEKLAAISKIVEAEIAANENLAEGCSEAAKLWEESVSSSLQFPL
jgi:type I site-specific restriction-modification system R (restriction) subunit